MSTSSRFRSFLENITVTPTQQVDAATKSDGVSRKLHSHYYSTTFDGATKMTIGSYGKGTPVRPPRDVDVLFIMPYEEFSRFNGYSGNGQSALLQEVKRLLQQRYPTTEKIRGDGQVVVVEFSGGHNVEVLPAWKRAGGGFLIPNTHDGGSWKHVDHNAEIDYIADSDQYSNGNTRALIKMMKVWQAHCNVDIKSLALELRSVTFLSSWQHAKESLEFYDWMVRAFFMELITKVNAAHKIPGIDEKCHYGDAWASKTQSAVRHAVKACDFEAKGREIDATLEWQKIFGDQYEF